MAKFGKKSDGSDKKSIANRIMGKWRTVAMLLMIFIFAAFIRIYFAADVTGSAFALSGGSDATYHFRVVREFAETGHLIVWDSSFNYPLTSVNPNPPFFDMMIGVVAYIAAALGMNSATAASAALAIQAPVFGILACVASYYLGREIVGSNAGGILTALFMAMSPVLISTSVLSMGTETAFVSFLTVMLFYFTVKFVRAVDTETDFGGLRGTIEGNKKALAYSIFAGVLMALIVMSWSGFHILIVMYSLLMAVQLIYDRFSGKDPRYLALFYSISIMLGLLIAVPAFAGASLFTQLLLGTLIYAIMACAACVAFAEARKVPWIVTVPVLVVALASVAVLLYYFGGGLFSDVFYGGSLYGSSQFAALMGGGSVSVSTLSVYFGWITAWLGWAAVFVMILLRKTMNSRHYLFTMSWLVILMALSWRSTTVAAISAPAYAVGFAVISIQIYKITGLEGYFVSLKASDAVPFIKKLFKPIPFLSILSVVLLVGAPNMMHAMDAGISYNEKDERNADMEPLFSGDIFGAIGYSVMTSDNWVIGDAFRTQADVSKDGAIFTWLEYASDAVTNGGYQSVSDSKGNGAEAASNMLLSSASGGGTIAAMMVRILSSNDVSSLETVLVNAGMSGDDYNDLRETISNPGSKKAQVLADPDRYGIISPGVSGENLMYIYLTNMLTENYTPLKIAKMYDRVCTATGERISYGAVGGTMLPTYSGYSNAFLMLAYLNGYIVDDGSVPQFATSTYFGFSYTDEMYDTYLWRSYMGMSPEEAGYTGNYAAYYYISDLSLSDGTVVPVPGFGMMGFEVEYWEVMYNPDDDATHSSEGWERMSQAEAVELQKVQGGLINYVSGLPVIMKYVGVSGTDAEGTVTMGGEAVSGIRVSAVDSDGTVRSTAFTDADGKYSITVPTGGKVNFYSGSVNLADGVLIQSSEPAATVDCAMASASLTGSLSGTTVPAGAMLKFTGTASGAVYEPTFSGNTFTISTMIPDIYSVEVFASDGTSLKTSTVTVHPGMVGTGFVIDLDDKKVEITVKNMYGEILRIDSLDGQKVIITNVDTGEPYDISAGADLKIAEGRVPAGWYIAAAASSSFGIGTGSLFQVSSTASSTTTTVTCMPVEDVTSYAPSENYFLQGPTFVSVNGVSVPKGADEGAVPAYSFYKADGDKVTWYLTSGTGSEEDGYKLSGVLKNSSGKAVSGTIAVIADDGRTLYLSVGSDGVYSVMLPDGEYTIYAYTTTQASIVDEIKIDGAAVENDISMGSAYKLSGTVKWGSFSLPYLNILATIGEDDIVIPLATDKSGAYSLMIPDSWKASVEIQFSSGSEFCFKVTDEDKNVTYPKVLEQSVNAGNTSNSALNFTVYASITIKNATSHEMKIGSTTVAPDEYYESTSPTSSSTMTIETVDSSGSYFKQTGMPVYNGMVLKENVNVFTEPYYELEITCDKEDKVEIKAVDDGKVINLTTSGATRKYMLLESCEYTVTVTSGDGKSMAVKNLLMGSADETWSVDESEMHRIVTFTGDVGVSAGGTMEVITAGGIKLQGTVSGGAYSIKVPVSETDDIIFSVEVTLKSDGAEYTYSGTRTVPSASILEEWDSAVVNLPVLGDGAGVLDTGVELDTTLTMMDASDLRYSKVEFTIDVTMISDRTVILSGGGWRSLTLYSDPERTVAASAISASGKLYATGIFDGMHMAAHDLAVTATDLSGESVATATLNDADSDWKKTDGEVTISRGIDVISGHEYRYAISANNTYNYAKTYTVNSISEIEGWQVDLISADGLTIKSLYSDAQTFDVKGMSEETVYVRFTSMTLQEADVGEVPGVHIVVEDDASSEAFNESFEHETAELSLDKTGAEGRGALNQLSGIPTIFWALLVITVLLILLTVWLGYKRGVFSRRK